MSKFCLTRSERGLIRVIIRNLVLSGMAYPVCSIVHFPYYDSIHNFLPTEIMYSVEMETIKRKLLRFPFGIIYPILNSSTLMISVCVHARMCGCTVYTGQVNTMKHQQIDVFNVRLPRLRAKDFRNKAYFLVLNTFSFEKFFFHLPCLCVCASAKAIGKKITISPLCY